MLDWIGVVLLCPFWALSRRSSVLSSGVRLWPCEPSGLGIHGKDNLNVVRSIARLLDHGCFTKPLDSCSGPGYG